MEYTSRRRASIALLTSRQFEVYRDLVRNILGQIVVCPRVPRPGFVDSQARKQELPGLFDVAFATDRKLSEEARSGDADRRLQLLMERTEPSFQA